MKISGFSWNYLFGLIGFIITFFASLTNNIFLTSLFRGIYSFIIWFVLAIAFQFILKFILQINQIFEQGKLGDNHKGNSIDMVTPQDDDLLKEMDISEDASFSPLNPPEYITQNEQKPEDLAKAISHMSENEDVK